MVMSLFILSIYLNYTATSTVKPDTVILTLPLRDIIAKHKGAEL